MLGCRLADVYLVVDEILRWDPHRAGARDPLEPAAKAVLGRSVTGMLTRWVVVTRSASVDRRSTGGAVPCQELLKSGKRGKRARETEEGLAHAVGVW